MSPERDEPIDDQDHELYEDVPPRSIFAATWFRVVLVVIVLGVVGAVAVPYVLDWMNPPPAPRTATTTRSPLSAPLTPAIPPASEKPATDRPLGDRLLGDRPVVEKRDSTLIPAPTPLPSTAAPAVPPARSEPKSELKPSPATPSAKAGPKPAAKAAVPEPKSEPRRASASGDPKGQSAMAVTENPAKAGAAKPSPASKPESASKDDSAPAAATKSTTPKRAVAKATTPAASTAAAGPYWVQIGAFKDADTAKRVAAKLREENFKVEESVKRVGGLTPPASTPAVKATSPAPAPIASGTDQYDVFVTGMSVEELNRRLAGKGLAAEGAGGGGVVVKPSLPLRDAVALSKDLAVEGFKVQVRRAGAAASAPAVVSAPSPAPATGEGGQALHRVRVGAFTDRAAAMAAARELENKGFKPYIARGDQ